MLYEISLRNCRNEIVDSVVATLETFSEKQRKAFEGGHEVFMGYDKNDLPMYARAKAYKEEEKLTLSELMRRVAKGEGC